MPPDGTVGEHLEHGLTSGGSRDDQAHGFPLRAEFLDDIHRWHRE